MIASKEIAPKNSLYYIGALILKELPEDDHGIEFFDLFEAVAEKNDISLKLFILGLDWLFLIDMIDTVKPHRWGNFSSRRGNRNRKKRRNVPRKTKSKLRRTIDSDY